MKRYVSFIILSLYAMVLWAKPADPRLLRQLLEQGDTASYRAMLEHWAGDRLMSQQMQSTASGIRKEMGGRSSANLSPKGLVVLVEFQDVKFTQMDSLSVDSMLNGDSYHYMGAEGSVRQYFSDQSNGQYRPHFEVVGPVTLAHSHDFYGEDYYISYGGGDSVRFDHYLTDVIIEACLAAESRGADLSGMDNDNDGSLDFVYVIYAGTGQASSGVSTDIWPCSGSLFSLYGLSYQQEYNWRNPLKIGGMKVDMFACGNELSLYRSGATYRLMRDGIGTFCHEFSHVIGLPDVYDTEYGYNYAHGLTPGAWHLMDAGSYNNNGITPPNYGVWDKFFCGWLTPTRLKNACDVELEVGDAVYVTSSPWDISGPTGTIAVYYLENRQQTGWDTYVPSHGLVTWAVSFNNSAWENNTVNNSQIRYGIYGNSVFPTAKGEGGFEAVSGKGISAIRETEQGTVQFRYMGGDGSLIDLCEDDYEWQAKKAMRKGNNYLSDYCWDVQMTGSDTIGYNAFHGSMFGLKTAPASAIRVSTSDINSCDIAQITVTSMGEGVTMTVSIGAVELGQVVLTNRSVAYTFANTGAAHGDIVITYSNISTQVGLKTIQVTMGMLTAVEQAHERVHANIYMVDGQLRIRKGQQSYDLMGRELNNQK